MVDDEVLRRFDAAEKHLLHNASKANQEDGIRIEEALESWTKAVKAHRTLKHGAE